MSPAESTLRSLSAEADAASLGMLGAALLILAGNDLDDPTVRAAAQARLLAWAREVTPNGTARTDAEIRILRAAILALA